MRHSIQLLWLLCVLFVLASCRKTETGSGTNRGAILNVTLRDSLSKPQLDTLFARQAGVPVGTVSFPYGARSYVLIYRTIDEFGRSVQASGLFFIPNGKTGPMPMGTYFHGTTPNKASGPSLNQPGGEQLISLALCANGYIVAMPDYLGLGYGEGLHPYQHRKSQATCGVDMLRAVKDWCARQDVNWNRQLFLTGYSQGGHVTMSVHQEIEQYHSNEFTVTAAAPASGAYDMSGAMVDLMLSTERYSQPFYLGFILTTFNRIYRLYPNLSDVINAPYDTSLIPLYDGITTANVLNDLSPNPPRNLIKDEVIADFSTNLNHPFRVALRDNDTYRWTYRAPIKMYYSRGDEQVPYQNSLNCLDSLRARGVTQVEAVKVSDTAGHNDAVLPILFQVLDWFNSLRSDVQ